MLGALTRRDPQVVLNDLVRSIAAASRRCNRSSRAASGAVLAVGLRDLAVGNGRRQSGGLLGVVVVAADGLLVAVAHTATWVTYTRVSKDTLGVGCGVADQFADLEKRAAVRGLEVTDKPNGNGIVSREDPQPREGAGRGMRGTAAGRLPTSGESRLIHDVALATSRSIRAAVVRSPGAKRLRITATATPESISA